MTYFTTLPDTLLVDGTDVQSLTGIIVTSLELWAPGDRKGENVHTSGRRGAIGVPKVYAEYEFSVGIVVEGTSRYDMITNLNAVGAILDGDGGLVTLTRRLSTSGGHVDHTAAGQFNSGLAAAILNEVTGQTELSFTNLDGCWFASGAPTVPIVP